MLFEVVPPRPYLRLVLTTWRCAFETGGDGVYPNSMLAFLVSLQIIDRAEAVNAGTARDITFIWLVVFQHVLSVTQFQPCIYFINQFGITYL